MKVQGILVAAVCLLLCLAGCAGPRQTETTSSGESHSAESTAPLDDADFQQESAGFAPTDQMTEPFTVSTPIQEVMDDPIFGRYGRLLFPVEDWYMSGDTLGELQLTWYNNIDPNETVEIAAWPTDGFVEANDFTGKTVIPFCTSSSSGLGESGELLAELAGTGDWQEGMRFRSSVSEGDVQEWLDSLSLS